MWLSKIWSFVVPIEVIWSAVTPQIRTFSNGLMVTSGFRISRLIRLTSEPESIINLAGLVSSGMFSVIIGVFLGLSFSEPDIVPQ